MKQINLNASALRYIHLPILLVRLLVETNPETSKYFLIEGKPFDWSLFRQLEDQLRADAG